MRAPTKSPSSTGTPQGMAPSGVGGGARTQSRFLPLSVFFLQMDGEEGEEGGEGKSVAGYVEKGNAKDKKSDKKRLGGFDRNTTSQIVATKGARPPMRKKEEDTFSTNVAAYPVPIGTKLIKKTTERRNWMNRLVQRIGAK